MADFKVQSPNWQGYDPSDASTVSAINQAFGGTTAHPWMTFGLIGQNAAALDKYRKDLASTNQLLYQQHQDDMKQQLAQGAMSNLAKLGYDVTGIPMLAQLLGPRGVLSGMDASGLIRADTAGGALQKAGAGYKDFAEAGMYPDVLPDFLKPRLGIGGKEGPALGVLKAAAGGGGGGKSDEKVTVTEGPYAVEIKRNPGESDESYAKRTSDARARLRAQSQDFGDVTGNRGVGQSFNRGAAGTPTPMSIDQFNTLSGNAKRAGGKVDSLGGSRYKVTGKDGSTTVIEVK